MSYPNAPYTQWSPPVGCRPHTKTNQPAVWRAATPPKSHSPGDVPKALTATSPHGVDAKSPPWSNHRPFPTSPTVHSRSPAQPYKTTQYGQKETRSPPIPSKPVYYEAGPRISPPRFYKSQSRSPQQGESWSYVQQMSASRSPAMEESSPQPLQPPPLGDHHRLAQAADARAVEIARLAARAEELGHQVADLRAWKDSKNARSSASPPPRSQAVMPPGFTIGARVRAVASLTVRGVQAVAAGDYGVIHGPSDDAALLGGINVQWERRRDGGTRRINVLPSDIEQIETAASPPGPRSPDPRQAPYHHLLFSTPPIPRSPSQNVEQANERIQALMEKQAATEARIAEQRQKLDDLMAKHREQSLPPSPRRVPPAPSPPPKEQEPPVWHTSEAQEPNGKPLLQNVIAQLSAKDREELDRLNTLHWDEVHKERLKELEEELAKLQRQKQSTHATVVAEETLLNELAQRRRSEEQLLADLAMRRQVEEKRLQELQESAARQLKELQEQTKQLEQPPAERRKTEEELLSQLSIRMENSLRTSDPERKTTAEGPPKDLQTSSSTSSLSSVAPQARKETATPARSSPALQALASAFEIEAEATHGTRASPEGEIENTTLPAGPGATALQEMSFAGDLHDGESVGAGEPAGGSVVDSTSNRDEDAGITNIPSVPDAPTSSPGVAEDEHAKWDEALAKALEERSDSLRMMKVQPAAERTSDEECPACSPSRGSRRKPPLHRTSSQGSSPSLGSTAGKVNFSWTGTGTPPAVSPPPARRSQQGSPRPSPSKTDEAKDERPRTPLSPSLLGGRWCFDKAAAAVLPASTAAGVLVAGVAAASQAVAGEEHMELFMPTPLGFGKHSIEQLQGAWRDNSGQSWSVVGNRATIIRRDGTSDTYIFDEVQGTIMLDSSELTHVSGRTVVWSDGDVWSRPVERDDASDDHPAVWMSMSRRSSVVPTRKNSVDWASSLNRVISLLADGPPSVDEQPEDEEEWWHVPVVDVHNVHFRHPPHGDPPGACSSPEINAELHLELSPDDRPALQYYIDGELQRPITRVSLERTEHGVFLLFPDENEDPVPDRVAFLPPDDMNHVVACVLSLCRKAGIPQDLAYEYEALANQEVMVQRFLQTGEVPWALAKRLCPERVCRSATDAMMAGAVALSALSALSMQGKKGGCLVM